MVTGNEVSAQEGLDHSRSVLVRGNSKPVTTFAEPGISRLAKMVTGNEVSAITGLGFCWVCVRGNSKPVTTFAEQAVAEVSRAGKNGDRQRSFRAAGSRPFP